MLSTDVAGTILASDAFKSCHNIDYRGNIHAQIWLIAALIPSHAPPAQLRRRQEEQSGRGRAKEALYALQEFIGGWKGSANDKVKGFWSEKSSWSWRFKDKERWMSFELENSKLPPRGARSAGWPTRKSTRSPSSTRPARKRSTKASSRRRTTSSSSVSTPTPATPRRSR